MLRTVCIVRIKFLKSLNEISHKIILHALLLRCEWKSFSFALSSLCTVFINYLLVSVIKLGCLGYFRNMNKNIFTFVFSAVNTAWVKDFNASLINIGCILCLCNINENMLMQAYSFNKNKITRSFILISFIYSLKI